MASAIRHRIAALIALAGLLASVACSPPPVPPGPERLRLSTAPSVAPLALKLAKQYQGRHSNVTVETDETGAEAALAAVAARKADLAFLEREPSEDELVNPEDGRRWLRAWPLASDGVAIVVHPSNPLLNIARSDLSRAYEGSERSWENLGGPHAPIQLVCREPGSPARIAFESYALEGKPVAGSAVVMPSDQAVADFVASHPNAIGYLSLSWVRAGVKLLALEGVSPNSTTIANGSYPLSHPLFVVTRSGMASKTQSFMNLLLGPEGRGIVAQMYAPAPTH